MLGHIHSHPGLHVACEPQVGHPCKVLTRLAPRGAVGHHSSSQANPLNLSPRALLLPCNLFPESTQPRVAHLFCLCDFLSKRPRWPHLGSTLPYISKGPRQLWLGSFLLL